MHLKGPVNPVNADTHWQVLAREMLRAQDTPGGVSWLKTFTQPLSDVFWWQWGVSSPATPRVRPLSLCCLYSISEPPKNRQLDNSQCRIAHLFPFLEKNNWETFPYRLGQVRTQGYRYPPAVSSVAQALRRVRGDRSFVAPGRSGMPFSGLCPHAWPHVSPVQASPPHPCPEAETAHPAGCIPGRGVNPNLNKR